jgi:hypothetical protein
VLASRDRERTHNHGGGGARLRSMAHIQHAPESRSCASSIEYPARLRRQLTIGQRMR